MLNYGRKKFTKGHKQRNKIHRNLKTLKHPSPLFTRGLQNCRQLEKKTNKKLTERSTLRVGQVDRRVRQPYQELFHSDKRCDLHKRECDSWTYYSKAKTEVKVVVIN